MILSLKEAHSHNPGSILASGGISEHKRYIWLNVFNTGLSLPTTSIKRDGQHHEVAYQLIKTMLQSLIFFHLSILEKEEGGRAGGREERRERGRERE